ncbi:hypothetical protein TRM7557_03694 [Tritonibacter multivorans]|uniref:Uncharacterized protein n=1 Tax=Tritonibacter multivorans TaxID=928856 RepID=A0A0P1GJ86_9RHOB|nr:hypothetical protein TRM7557_03694 [Tritonibacter multivorans]SFC92509.1 hypothetical protein SAMN04488049_10538 [Tritonibacter multivorans]
MKQGNDAFFDMDATSHILGQHAHAPRTIWFRVLRDQKGVEIPP